MQLIIPMTGEGSRFSKAGFQRLKPFIKIHGKPLLWWILQIFPKMSLLAENKIHLILRADHYKSHDYITRDIDQFAPKTQIHLIDNHDERGPLPNILKVSSEIDDQQPIFISYCDFYMHWDIKKYLTELATFNPDGSMPCYTGFHPHLLPKENLYACAKVDNENFLLEVREKYSFTEDKSKSLHSPGVYYFKNGILLKKYFQQAIKENLSTKGEFYCSLAYNLMVRDKLKVYAPSNVTHFCQWGTPRDLNDYLYWINLLLKPNSDSAKQARPDLSPELYEKTLSYWRTFLSNENITQC